MTQHNSFSLNVIQANQKVGHPCFNVKQEKKGSHILRIQFNVPNHNTRYQNWVDCRYMYSISPIPSPQVMAGCVVWNRGKICLFPQLCEPYLKVLEVPVQINGKACPNFKEMVCPWFIMSAPVVRDNAMVLLYRGRIWTWTSIPFQFLETANKSNVVTASTAIQLLDDRKSPVVAGKSTTSFI